MTEAITNGKPTEAAAPAANGSPPVKLSASNVAMGMMPRTLDEGIKLANLLAKSALVPKDFQNNAANVFLALQWGSEIGLAPMQALQSIAVINGRPAVWGDAMLALVMASPVFGWIKEPPVVNGEARCEVMRKGAPEPIIRTFTIAQAERAGLLAKSNTPWKTYPDRMLQMRARGFALRDAFPDVLRGVISVEEAQDIPSPTNGETIEISAITPPQRNADVPSDPATLDAPVPAPMAIAEASDATAPAEPTLSPTVTVVAVQPKKVGQQTIYAITLSDGRAVAVIDGLVAKDLTELRDAKTPLRDLVIAEDASLKRHILIEYSTGEAAHA